MIGIREGILKNFDYTKRLNLVFNVLLLTAAAVALPYLAEPTKMLTSKWI